MRNAMPPLSALKAFEAAARHLSFTRAAVELNVTPGALSHQIRGLEDFLGMRLFERRTRAVALTAEGRQLYPGLQAGFGLIREAVASLGLGGDDRVLVLSTAPGLTAKWLAPRLYRFVESHPDIDLRISSTSGYANFMTDGVDAALRSVPTAASPDPTLAYETLAEAALIAVCSPRLIERLGPLDRPGALAQVPLLHDDALVGFPEAPSWEKWFATLGQPGGDLRRGLRFNHSNHALDAALEGAGLLLTQSILAYDDLRGGRLVIPFDLTLPSGRAYCLVYPKAREREGKIGILRDWLRDEIGRMDAGVLPRT
ncbi:MAG TPA: transcriptional regulator GcvA [Rhodocyclaceae bacterium]|nr:transcriptional regulator GcvA [Rhodocyclaceae bacterium]